MNKKEFINIMNKLRSDADFYDKLSDLCDNREDSILIFPKSFDVSIKLLADLMHDKEIISWWIFDKDFGRNKDINLFEEDGSPIKLDTAGELYDYLKEC